MKYLFVLLFGLFTLPLHAAEPLNVTYGLYAGGFNVVDINGTYTVTGDTYDLQMDLKTQGLLGRLAPWAGDIQSNGVNKGDASTPLRHSFASTWRDETETKIFTFDNDGQLQSYNVAEDDGTVENKMPAPEVYAGNPVDMMTALFRAMNNKNTCQSSHLALDGKRAFNMVFTSKGQDMLQANKYSVYEGEAEICEVEIVPVAGKWREKPRGWMSIQGQAKDKGQLPRLWFGRVRDDMPQIPVRFFIKTNYGAMIMHLKDVQG